MIESRPSRPPGLDPVTRFVRSLDGDFYMLREVADHLGMPTRSLRTLARRFPMQTGPSLAVMFGRLKVFLYTPEDLDRAVAFQRRRRSVDPQLDDLAGGPGRPALWTSEESRQRHRSQSKLYYWRRRAAELAGEGQMERAADASARVVVLADLLDDQRDMRLDQREAA